MYARFYKFHMAAESFDEMLAFFDDTAKPLIESVEGHLGLQSVRTTETESIMVSFYKNKEAADAASQKAAPIRVRINPVKGNTIFCSTLYN